MLVHKNKRFYIHWCPLIYHSLILHSFIKYGLIIIYYHIHTKRWIINLSHASTDVLYIHIILSSSFLIYIFCISYSGSFPITKSLTIKKSRNWAFSSCTMRMWTWEDKFMSPHLFVLQFPVTDIMVIPAITFSHLWLFVCPLLQTAHMVTAYQVGSPLHALVHWLR